MVTEPVDFDKQRVIKFLSEVFDNAYPKSEVRGDAIYGVNRKMLFDEYQQIVEKWYEHLKNQMDERWLETNENQALKPLTFIDRIQIVFEAVTEEYLLPIIDTSEESIVDEDREAQLVLLEELEKVFLEKKKGLTAERSEPFLSEPSSLSDYKTK